MEHKGKLLGFYNYTVILTYIGMLSGFVGILRAMDAQPFAAVLCLMVAGICDMFDGAIASTMKRTEAEKCFGIQIDSLSDLICFGVLPGALCYSFGRGSLPATIVSGLYALCALIRLAYFNVDEQERQKTTSEGRKVYLGMPVTLSALFVPLLYALSACLGWDAGFALSLLLPVMAALFLLPIPLKKPGRAGKALMAVCGVAVMVFVVMSCR